MVGINEVARRAGGFAATVSRALSGNRPVSAEARARVTSPAHERHYVVSSNASSLASGRTRNVGVVVPHLNRWFFSSVVEGAERALLQNGYDLTLNNLSGGGKERRSVFDHFLRRRRVDVSIVGIDDHELAEFFQLTTVAQFPKGQGELAAEILIAGIEPSRRYEPFLLVPLPLEPIVRSSTAQPQDRAAAGLRGCATRTARSRTMVLCPRAPLSST
jgi:DNA-binding LacI/PurR family transcriptional regulator